MMKFGITIPRALYIVAIKIALVWTLINVGYYFVLPWFGFSLSYNSSPISIALYYSICAVITIWYFRDSFRTWIGKESHIWWYGLWSLASAVGLCGLVYIFSLLPILQGPLSPPYTDLLFATPWYFLPKAIEILIQRLLITILIVEIYAGYHSIKKSDHWLYRLLCRCPHYFIFIEWISCSVCRHYDHSSFFDVFCFPVSHSESQRRFHL